MEREPPADDADPLEHVLFRQHDVISRRQAVRHLTVSTLRHRVRSGRWQRPHRSVFVARPGALGTPQRRWAAVLSTGGVLAGFSALEALGLRGYGKEHTEILLPAARRAAGLKDTVVVRTVAFHAEDILPDRLPPSTTAARAMVDAAQWARDDTEAVAVIAASVQQRLVGGDDARAVLARLRNLRREGLIAEAVVDALAGSHAVSEIDFVRLCRRYGLPIPNRQVERRDARGRRRYRDAVFEEWDLHVEIDAGQHVEVKTWPADLRQHNDIAIRGGRLLRFTAWQIRHDPAAVAVQLRAALRAAGWHP